MAIIASKVLWWKAVEGADQYRVRIVQDGEVTEDNSNLGDYGYDVVDASAVNPDSNEVEIDLGTLKNVVVTEGTYDVFITAADEAGNESDPLVIADAYLDFQPPAAPTNGGFR